MLTFEVITSVLAPVEIIRQNFTAALFTQLNPSFPPVKLLRFDGNEVGALVELELNFLLFKQRWTSRITAAETTENSWFFVDEGIQLPFFLSSWRHKHLIEATNGCTNITDRITLSGPAWLPDILLVMLFKGMMLYRKPIYRQIFGKV